MQEMPGINGNHTGGCQSGSTAKAVPHKEEEENAARDADKKLRETGSDDTEAEEFNHNGDQIGQQRTHLAIAPS